MSTPVQLGAGQDAERGVVASLKELIALRAQAYSIVRGRSVSSAFAPGNHLALRQSRGMEFAEARPYQSGDDVRVIDWRQTARRGHPYTKLFQEEHERPVQLLVDLGASMRFGSRVAFKSVQAARVAALLAWRAVAVGDRVGALVCQGNAMRVIRPESRASGVLPLLAALVDASAAPSAAPGMAWETPLQALARSVRPGRQIVILSDFASLDVAAERELLVLARSAELWLIHIYDGLEAQAPQAGCYRVSDGQRSVTLDLRSAAVRSAYRAAFAERRLRLQALARQGGVRLLALATHHVPETVLHAMQKVGPGWRLPAGRELV